MFKKSILLVAVLSLAACEDVYWRYGMTDEQLAIDQKACHQQALAAVPVGTGDYTVINNLEKQCMALKGWHRSTIPPPFPAERGGERGE